MNLLGGTNPNVRKFLSSVWAPTRHSLLRRIVRAYFRPFVWQRRVQQLFRQLELALVAKVLASGAKVDMMTEQVSICRISRALAAALYTLTFEAMFMAGPADAGTSGLLWMGASFLLIAAGGLIVVGAYSRFCQIMFSLLYVTSQRCE